MSIQSASFFITTLKIHRSTTFTNSSPELQMQDLEDCIDKRLDNFLDPITSDQETPFDEFEIQHLTVGQDRNSCRPYRHKLRSVEATQRYLIYHTKLSIYTTQIQVLFSI